MLAADEGDETDFSREASAGGLREVGVAESGQGRGAARTGRLDGQAAEAGGAKKVVQHNVNSQVFNGEVTESEFNGKGGNNGKRKAEKKHHQSF